MVRAAKAVKATKKPKASKMPKASRESEVSDEAGAPRPRGRGAEQRGRPGPGIGARSGTGDHDRENPPRPAGLRTRLRWRRILVLLLALAVPLGGFGSWVLYGSPWLRVESVSVTGTRALSDSAVSRAAEVPTGAPLITVDKAAVQRRVRQALPRVREVTAERSWPHGVTLTVTERRPELLLESAGKYREVDSEGVRFATVGKPPKGVPLLVLEPKEPEGERYFSAARLRREAARVTHSLPDSVHRAVRTVTVRSYDDISLELTEGRTVRWGSAELGAAKAKALAALMKAAKNATHFDVTAPSAPAASDS
ncbi:cell division protein FtsQ/DivIB [Streptomyces sp. 8N114]|uniref:cell division protein FtsQ/DivIB n=1 Tax=Streptomyces sp. 8N114 TaxID=3457419 RepID=UPI003FD56983